MAIKNRPQLWQMDSKDPGKPPGVHFSAVRMRAEANPSSKPILLRSQSFFEANPSSRSVLLLGGALERRAEDIAERRARIGGAILGDRLLLLGDFECLDRDRHLVGTAVELGHPGVDLLADRKAFGALIGALAGEFRTLDEGGEVGPDQLHFEAGFLDLGDLAGHHRALLDVAGFRERIAFELLDAERDSLLLHAHLEARGGYLS